MEKPPRCPCPYTVVKTRGGHGSLLVTPCTTEPFLQPVLVGCRAEPRDIPGKDSFSVVGWGGVGARDPHPSVCKRAEQIFPEEGSDEAQSQSFPGGGNVQLQGQKAQSGQNQ